MIVTAVSEHTCRHDPDADDRHECGEESKLAEPHTTALCAVANPDHTTAEATSDDPVGHRRLGYACPLMDAAPDSTGAAAAVNAFSWYHTIDLPAGLSTPGWVDCRPIRDQVLIPPRLDGLRVLDVGTWDGFWAFDLERRGAHVTTVDVPDADDWDWPPRMRLGDSDVTRRDVVASTTLGEGFQLAQRLLDSNVESRKLNVYDLSPDSVGMFDLVVVGSILLHLRDPVGALAAVRSVARDRVVLNEAIELLPTVLSPRTPRARLEGVEEVRWWQPNLATVEHFVRSAGLRVRRRTRPFFVPLGSGHPLPSAKRQLRALLTPAGREHVIAWRVGIAHVSLECELERSADLTREKILRTG